MKKTILTTFAALICLAALFAQKTTIEGYAFETDNRGYLREVKITVYSIENAIKGETMTNEEGYFSLEVNANTYYKIKASKDIFEDTYVSLKEDETPAGDKAFVKFEMARKPGYLFDVTLSENFFGMDGSKNSIDSATIEIFNNTTEKEELVLSKHAIPAFQFTFEQGNHYTVMVRKKGYFTKRMEAHVNVDGCILCFEGIGTVRPSVSPNLTENHTMGTLLANVEMEKIRLDHGIKVENIYYETNQWQVSDISGVELDKVINMMKSNPNLIIELGSHTDSQGSDTYNQELSQKRAQAAVAYIMRNGNIPPARIKARGYGENQLINGCRDGVSCPDSKHQENRRTEVKIIGFTEIDPYEGMSLRDILFQEKLDNFTFDDAEATEYKAEEVTSDEEEMPEDLKRYIEEQKRKEAEAAGKTTPADTPPPPKPAPKKPTPPQQPASGSGNGGSKSSAPTPRTGAFGDPIDISSPAAEKPKASKPSPKSAASGKGPKIVASDFNGHMVEFFNSGVELSPDHSLFKQYGQVRMQQRPDGGYAYLIGGFKSKIEAENYLEKVLVKRFPTAKVVEFQNGERVK